MADITCLSRDLMFQQALRRFGQFRSIRVEEPISVKDAVMIGLDAKEVAGTWTADDGPKVPCRIPLLFFPTKLNKMFFGYFDPMNTSF